MIKVIAFDADDTLWHNESYFREIEDKFRELLEEYVPQHTVSRELFHTEIQNIELYGYGIKAFILSMIETSIRISGGTIHIEDINKIINYGKDLLAKPVEVFDGVEDVLKFLNGNYRLVLATKGDLLDQERKLDRSGLSKYFHHIEVMSAKEISNYKKLINHLDITPSEFMMVGNSLKSDILPVLELGGSAIHIPYHITWDHEKVEHKVDHENLLQLENIKQVEKHFKD